MFEPPKLTSREWELLCDLVEREIHDLPVEIRHTRSSELSGELHRRMDTLHDMLQRMRAALVEPSAV